jgi:hypothetical protein
MYICTCRQYHLYSDDKVCQWLATGQWFSQSTAVSSNNKIGRHDITEILLKVLSNTIILTPLYSGKLTRLQYRMSLDVIKSSKKRRKKCNTHQSLQKRRGEGGRTHLLSIWQNLSQKIFLCTYFWYIIAVCQKGRLFVEILLDMDKKKK